MGAHEAVDVPLSAVRIKESDIMADVFIQDTPDALNDQQSRA